MDVLEYCARQQAIIGTALRAVDEVFANPGQFEIGPGRFEVAMLVGHRAALEADLAAVKRSASGAMQRRRDGVLPQLTATRVGLPRRHDGNADTMSTLAEALAAADPLVAALRDAQPAGACRRGFDVGLVVEGRNLSAGDGSQRFQDGLGSGEQVGYAVAAAFCFQRNRLLDAAERGAAVVRADTEATAARALLQPPGLSWLGFDVGSGLFGDPADGAVGLAATEPRSDKIRTILDPEGQRGFDAARDFQLGRRPA